MVTKNPKIRSRHKCKTEIRTGSNQIFFSISEQTASSLSFSSDLVRGVRASASVERRSRERRETRALVTRVVICVSRTFYSTDQEKRETARSLISETRGFFSKFTLEAHASSVSSMGHFPSVKTDRPENSSHNDNFTCNQNYPQRSQMACTKEWCFNKNSWKKAFFIVKMTGPAMVRPVSSDFWKGP